MREVKANFGEEDFVFDIYSYLKAREMERKSEIQQVKPLIHYSINPSIDHLFFIYFSFLLNILFDFFIDQYLSNSYPRYDT